MIIWYRKDFDQGAYIYIYYIDLFYLTMIDR